MNWFNNLQFHFEARDRWCGWIEWTWARWFMWRKSDRYSGHITLELPGPKLSDMGFLNYNIGSMVASIILSNKNNSFAVVSNAWILLGLEVRIVETCTKTEKHIPLRLYIERVISLTYLVSSENNFKTHRWPWQTRNERRNIHNISLTITAYTDKAKHGWKSGKWALWRQYYPIWGSF